MRMTYRNASCPTAAVARVHTLSFAAWPSPTPRQPKRGRSPSRSRNTGISRMAVWATTPIVENPATRRVWKDPQLSSVWGLAALAPMMRDEHAQPGDRHDVVQDRRPHGRPEGPVGVEDLGQQGVQAVEEDLRKAPEGEGHGQGLLLRRIALGGQFE